MRLKSIKFLVIGLLLMIGFLSIKQANAYIPDLEGYVRVAGTNAPVANVWVKLTTSGCPDAATGGLRDATRRQSRYAKTDNSGFYVFEGWSQGVRGQAGVMIDTDFNGSLDSEWYPSIDLCDNTGPPGNAFSCGRDPFQFTVVRPSGWGGSFTSVGQLATVGCDPSDPVDVCINNSQAAPNVATIFYTPGAATPTKTPTPTRAPTSTPRPTSTRAPTSTPRPTPTPCLIPGCITATPDPTDTPAPTDVPDPTDTPEPTGGPTHLSCVSASCIRIDGAGADSCLPEDATCEQTTTGCPNACGNFGTITQTCTCSGPCCPGTCRNGLSCGQSGTVTCCNSRVPVVPTSLIVSQPTGGTTIHTRFVTLTWNFPAGGVGCGTPWGFNCSGNSAKFSIQIDNNSDYSSPIVNVQNLPTTARTYTTTAADGILSANTTYYARVCAENYLETCAQVIFTKEAYPNGTVSGTIGEYDSQSAVPFTNGGAGGNTIAINVIPPVAVGISSTCTKTTGGAPPTTLSYNCTIALDNVNNDPVPTQTFTISASGYNSNVYTGICLQNGANCTTPTTIPLNFDVNGGSISSTNNVYFILNSTLTFFKIKNGSIQTQNSSLWSTFFPVSTLLYDATGQDYNTGGNYLIIGNSAASYAGVGTALFNNPVSMGSALASQKSIPYPPGKNWISENYMPLTSFNSQRYLEYVRTRKEYQTITDLSQLDPEKINVWNTNTLTITDAAPFSNKNVVLIVDGTVIFSLSSFTPVNASTAIIADTINFSSGAQFVTEARGIFIGNTVNLGSSNQPIKITGNISSTQNSIPLSRIRDDNRKPSVFVVFEITPYINLLSHLSTALYEWKQLQ